MKVAMVWRKGLKGSGSRASRACRLFADAPELAGVRWHLVCWGPDIRRRREWLGPPAQQPSWRHVVRSVCKAAISEAHLQHGRDHPPRLGFRYRPCDLATREVLKQSRWDIMGPAAPIAGGPTPDDNPSCASSQS